MRFGLAVPVSEDASLLAASRFWGWRDTESAVTLTVGETVTNHSKFDALLHFALRTVAATPLEHDCTVRAFALPFSSGVALMTLGTLGHRKLLLFSCTARRNFLVA